HLLSSRYRHHRLLHSFPTRRSSDLGALLSLYALMQVVFAPLLGQLSDAYGRRPVLLASLAGAAVDYTIMASAPVLWVLYIGRLRSEEHTSELQSRENLVCRLLLEKK